MIWWKTNLFFNLIVGANFEDNAKTFSFALKKTVNLHEKNIWGENSLLN